jgi:hypothetical protein
MSELMILPPQSERAQAMDKARRLKGLYAALPGTGPEGETCGSCKHIFRVPRYRKCGLCRSKWTGGPGTDIKARAPACSKWEAA